MQRILLCALFCAASIAAPTPAFAWMTEPALNPDNGHYYAFFTAGGTSDAPRLTRPPMPFADALTLAAATSHYGIPGHLATITSQAEQDFVFRSFVEHVGPISPGRFHPDDLFWIAGSDSVVEGEWRWVAGPESGKKFWQGNQNGVPIGYQNWRSSNGRIWEPNNGAYPDGEDFIALSFDLYLPLKTWWNDVSTRDDSMSFVPRLGLVEFSVIPEPSSAMLIASAGLMLVAACRRRVEARR